MDEGDLASNFASVVGYNFETNGYTYVVLASQNSMTKGLFYRFRVRALNSLGYSAFSDVLMIGLGPLPS